MPCTITIRDLVGIDTDGDGERDRLVVVGTVEDCATLTVSVNTATVPAEVLAPGESAFGVVPASAERVFLGRFGLTDTTAFKGRCGTRLRLTVTAECTADSTCRATLEWDGPVQCEPDQPTDDCPTITVSAVADPGCDNGHRDVTLTVTTVPFTPGPADLVLGDVDPVTGDPATATVTLDSLAGGVLGQGGIVHSYPAPEAGTAHYPVQVRVGRCTADPVDVAVEACPPPPPPSSPTCPDMRLASEVDAGCDSAGNRVVRVRIVLDPPHDGFVRITYGSGRERTVHTGGAAVVQVDLLYAPNDLSQPVVRVTPLTDDGSEICTQELRLRRLPAPCPPVPPPVPPDEEPDDEEPDAEEPDDEEPDGDTDPDSDTETPPEGLDLCLAGLILVLLLLLAAGAATVVAFCMPNPVTVGIAAGFAGAALVALVLWMLLCGGIRCDLVRWLIFALAILAVVALVVAAVLAAIGTQNPATLACAVGALATFAYYGTIGLYVTLVAIELGCYDGRSVLPWEPPRRVRA